MARFIDGLALARPNIWGGGLDGVAENSERTFALPAGTVTFLLTDIEGSTRLWEAHPTEMAHAVPAHYELLAEAVARHGGVRPVEQGEGDSVVAAFSRASDAVAAALDAQRALATARWPGDVELRVRIALHTAEAQLRDEGNYFGIALSRCARLRAIAHGGQTLLSRSVHDLVLDTLPGGATLLDLGSHRLRDLGRPEHVFALGHPELPAEEGPLRSLDAWPNNLPEQLTSFVGREHELAQIGAELARTRLLTLTGAGGCGKTRLATQVAADTLDAFPDGAWWVELAPLSDPQAVGPTLGEALGVKPLAGQTSLQAVIAHLARARALIVLDNCEHLLDACASTAEELLRGCQDVTVLATSRAPLGVDGETHWRVPSLSLPAEREPEQVESIAQSDAVRLFIERALKVRPNFHVEAANAPAIAQICHDLDGIPLAIELAAARVRVLGVEQIAAGLSDRFRLLTGGARSAMPRQQTLRASVDWSHELLDGDEQLLLRRLAVFAGGWTLDAAEEVCADERLDRLAILDLLTSLLDKSLLVADEHGGNARYRLLETVRQYAHDHLAQTEELKGLRDRHRDAYLRRAEETAPHLEVAGQGAWLDALDAEHANLALALDHAIESDRESALRLCVALTVWWKLRGRFALAESAYVRALDAAREQPSALAARVLWARGYLLAYAGGYEEAVASELAALEMAEALGETSTIARALDVLGTIQIWADPIGAREGLERARRLALECGDEWCYVDATQIVGYGLLMQSRTEAETVFEEALEMIERTGYAEFAAWHWTGIGILRHSQGRYEEAFALYEQAIAVAEAVGEPVSTGIARSYRAIAWADRGEAEPAQQEVGPAMERAVSAGAGMAIPILELATSYAQAAAGEYEPARAGLQQVVDQGAGDSLQGTTFTLTMLARVELAHGMPSAAAEHATTARELAQGSLANQLLASTANNLLAACALAADEPSEAETLAHAALADAVEHDFRPQVQSALDVLAGVAAMLESYEEAARILGASERLREELGHVRWDAEQVAIERLRDALGGALGEREATETIEEGRAMGTADAIGWLRRARGARKRPAGGWESLTPTELQVVELAAEGLTNPEIAERMFIARGTVKIHLSHVYAKLDVRNRSELAALVSRRAAA
ncbi:MAG TPA: LuxR C-terminal-related transcriptional regulator [Solirubrobacteraceae bacterium]|nr:LuxR C-terminal-related transcriptional regulator [Solirubrobacteraceae bacterium]